MGLFRFVFSLVSERIIMADAKEPLQSVQTFGRKKNATAVAYCKRGKGLLKVNGRPLEEVEPKALQYKLQEPLLLLGKDRFADVDIRIRVKGGGHTSQIYAIRQALSKSLVAYYQKYVDEQSKKSYQRHFDPIRQNIASSRSKTMRSQEIRRSWCKSQIPEILQIDVLPSNI